MVYSDYRFFPNYKESNFFLFVKGFNKADARYAGMKKCAELHISCKDIKIFLL